MAYAQGNTASRNSTTLVLVAGIHAIAIYAIVTGLAGPMFGPKPDKPFEGFQIDNVNKPKDPPPPPDKQHREITDKVQVTETVKPVGGDPLVPFELGNGGGTLGAGGAISEVEFPIADPPRPQPSFAAIGPRPRGSSANWVTQIDYPTREINLGHEGLTRVRLTVSPNGKVSGCEVTATSGWPGLDSTACNKLTARGKFDPAKDSSGQVATGVFSTSVRWQLPE